MFLLKTIVLSLEQPLKSFTPISSKPSPIVTLIRFRQLLNADLPIFVVLFGITILSIDLHPSKAPSPIVVTQLGIIMLAMAVLEKALFPIVKIFSDSILSIALHSSNVE